MREGSGHRRWRFLIGAVCLALAVSVPAIALGATLTPVYRFYNTKTGTHFYTASETEKANVQSTMGATYTFEGVAYNLETDNPQMNAPLYRFYNKVTGTHFYTASETEKANIVATMAATFTYEGVAYNVSGTAAGNTPVYRFYNKKTGTHFYTASETEKANIQATLSGTYTYEGPAFYLAYTTTPPPPVDTTPPVTATDLVSVYRGTAVIQLFASDADSGVDRTYYRLDGAPAVQGSLIFTRTLGDHTIEYWSVDQAGNEETHHNAAFTLELSHIETDVTDCQSCHAGDLMAVHDSIASNGAGPGCAACHASGVTPKFICTDCHGPVADPTTHPSLATDHVRNTGLACAGADTCHNVDVSEIHANTLTGCDVCHGAGITPTTNCESAGCHVGGYAGYHPAQGAAVHKVTGFCYTSGCHVMTTSSASDAALIHNSWANPPGCAACHAPGVTPKLTCFDAACHGAGGATMETTHAYAHPSAAGESSKGCTVSSCHGSEDVLALTPGHSGCSCHTYDSDHLNDIISAGILGDYAECVDCHADPMDPAAAYPYHVAVHATFEDTVDGVASDACVACHGNDLLGVGGVDLHVKDAHAGCVCHECDDLLDRGMDMIGAKTSEATECVSCHKDAFAPHGFADGISAHHDESWVAASGHNTTQLGTVGAYEKFDGSEGVTIRDAAGAVITATYPLPTQNVFWEAADPEAPAGAMTGLSWNTVVTCEDCHTGLVGYEVDGPHGAQMIADMGVDPAFPGEFETAALWAFIAPAADGSIVATDKVGGVPAPMAASGIVQYVPGGPNTVAPSAYALKTYLDATTSIPGPAVVEDPDSVICAKCHDLHNPGTGHAEAGVSVENGDGYAHYHGHDYHDNPVAYAGLYKASDETTYTAFAKRTATDVELKAASAGRGASGHCRNCHVAVPHGWKRPRLLVYETDSAPYNIGPSVEYVSAEAEGRVRNGVGEAGQLKGISSVRSPEMSHEGEAGEYVNWSGAEGMTCQACGHHTAAPTPGNMWE